MTEVFFTDGNLNIFEEKKKSLFKNIFFSEDSFIMFGIFLTFAVSKFYVSNCQKYLGLNSLLWFTTDI